MHKKPKECLGDLWPTSRHPLTGEPFERCGYFSQKRTFFETDIPEPKKPQRYVLGYDSLRPYLKDIGGSPEYRKRLEHYIKDHDAWESCGGKKKVLGPIVTEAMFITASGAYVTGTRDHEWKWNKWGL